MFDQITLPSGLRIIGERIPHFRSVSVGLWIGTGSQFETPKEAGLSHVMEHMAFKGTNKRTARQIAEEMDAVGGMMNAFTSKELTCYYAKVVDEHLPLAMDVLCDMVTSPALDPAELAKEKGVILEEISMAEDTPEDVAGELVMLAQFGDQPIARPILGSTQSVSGFSSDDIRAYWQETYRPENAVLSVAGNYNWDKVVEMAGEMLVKWQGGLYTPRAFETNPVSPVKLYKNKDIEQVHICLAYPGIDYHSDDNYAFALFNSVFGGSMSSRLFQRVREESGLVYTVYSYPNAYRDCGSLSVYAATNPDSVSQVMDLLMHEAEVMANEGLGEREFQMAREQLKSGYIMGLESTSAKMQSNGRRLLLHNTTRTESEVIDKVNAITLEQVNRLARETLTKPFALALVGKDADKLGL